MQRGWINEEVWGTAADGPQAEIIGGPADGGKTDPIKYAAERDYVTMDGLRYSLRTITMKKTEDRPERTVLVAIHPGWPAYPLV